MTQARLLIVDDEQDMLNGLQRIVDRNLPKVGVVAAASGEEALALHERGAFEVALLDIQMPGMDGLELLERLQQRDPLLTVLVMTAYGTIEVAVDAMKRGAYDFITKPFEKEVLLQVIAKALERSGLLRENVNLKRKIGEQGTLAEFVGQSPPMQRLFDSIRTIARTDYTVLVRGESGTGKELVARAIHNLSDRRAKRLVTVNCPAVPEHLLESELFGHKKGAFTGADRDHAGLFSEADTSSICLDEIGDIPVQVQTKLLRVLQEQEVKSLGESRPRTIDVRVIALTNRNLEEKIAESTFREDLFYRLNVVTLWTPSLQEIREDIPLLVRHFASRVCDELGTPLKSFSPEAIRSLMERPWPGNVRELQNVVRRALLFCGEESVEVKHLHTPAEPQRQPQHEAALFSAGDLEPYKEAKERLVRNFEEEYVGKLLAGTGGNVTRAAALSGLTRAALQKIMRRADIRSGSFRREGER